MGTAGWQTKAEKHWLKIITSRLRENWQFNLVEEMKMSARILAALTALVIWLIPAVAPAGPLFPLQMGGYYSYDGSDAAGHTWTCKLKVVAQGITLANGQTYYHVRQKDGDPFDPNKANPQDCLFRCTDTQGWMSVGGGEALQFQTGPTSTPSWITPDGDTASIIADSLSVTVPYGTFNPVYEDQYISSDPYSQPWYAYLFPNLGMIKQVDYWVDTGRAPAVLALRQVGTKPVVLWPMNTGMLLIYNASDALGNHWTMTKQVQGQVNIQGLNYFKVKTNNFDPIGGENGGITYLRSTDQQVYGSFDASNANLWYQAASPGTTWSYPAEGGVGTMQMTIDPISQQSLQGGSYLAYVNQATGVQNGTPGPNSSYFYLVPGVGLTYQDDYRLDGNGTRLYFTLAKIVQAGAGPGISLLLMD